MSVLVEVVCYNIEDVLRARQGGAQRVELCASPGAGGTTPNYGLIKQSVALADLDVMVMIRPRGGDFLYSEVELEQMKEDIKVTAQLGAKGVVFGVLNKSGFIDTIAMDSLVSLAKSLGLEVTCHRAFDVAQDPMSFLQILIDLGVDRLLTSGQQKTAIEGLDLLQELRTKASDKLTIMPGGGVRANNAAQLLQAGFNELHTGSNIKVPSKMEDKASQVEMGSDDAQGFHMFVDPKAIHAIKTAL